MDRDSPWPSGPEGLGVVEAVPAVEKLRPVVRNLNREGAENPADPPLRRRIGGRGIVRGEQLLVRHRRVVQASEGILKLFQRLEVRRHPIGGIECAEHVDRIAQFLQLLAKIVQRLGIELADALASLADGAMPLFQQGMRDLADGLGQPLGLTVVSGGEPAATLDEETEIEQEAEARRRCQRRAHLGADQLATGFQCRDEC